jgi:predicted unusual protein kinase regulating ubiquinone biosynthesis (AarF/ABC1/UbiB family)
MWPLPSFAAGVKITDTQRLQAAGVPTELVARRATEAYLMQVRGPAIEWQL